MQQAAKSFTGLLTAFAALSCNPQILISFLFLKSYLRASDKAWGKGSDIHMHTEKVLTAFRSDEKEP